MFSKRVKLDRILTHQLLRISKTEEYSLSWYIESSNEEMLATLDKHKILPNHEDTDPVQCKDNIQQIVEIAWKEKEMHGQFPREIQGEHRVTSLNYIKMFGAIILLFSQCIMRS